jgi:hypothetical protein
VNTRSRSALNKLRQLYPYAKSLETFGKISALLIKGHLLSFENCWEMVTAEVLTLHENIRGILERFYGKP